LNVKFQCKKTSEHRPPPEESNDDESEGEKDMTGVTVNAETTDILSVSRDELEEMYNAQLKEKEELQGMVTDQQKEIEELKLENVELKSNNQKEKK
jgi:hypothetical protein